MQTGASTIQLSLDSIRDIAHLGARRASAFLSIARSRQAGSHFSNFTLGAADKFDFWPNPIDLLIAESATSEFDNWVLGSCLRELHLHLELFLDEIWLWANLIQKYGSTPPSNAILGDKKFTSNPSVSDKYETLSALLGANAAHLAPLRALHLLRNCLSHGAGYVRERDCNEVGSLNIEWLGFEKFLIDGDIRVDLKDAIENGYVTRNSSEIFLEIVKREKTFAFGAKVELPLEYFGEICWFYIKIAENLMSEFRTFLVSKGVPIAEGQ